MNLFSIENGYLFPELTVGDVKCKFCYKEGILMKTDPFPAFMSDIEYSVIKSEVIKSFDCNSIPMECLDILYTDTKSS